MKPFRKAGARTWFLRLHRPDHSPVDLATGTRDAATAKAMGRSIERLKERKRYAPLIEALAARTLDVERVWQADEADALGDLLAELQDTNVEPLVADFHDAMAGKVADDTRQHYRHAIRTLLTPGAPFPASRLNASTLQGWVDGMEVSPGTVLKRAAGMSRFCAWLVKPKGVLEANPMATVELPPPGKPRLHFLDTPDAIRLADAQPAGYRELSALLAGTGIDVSVALALTRRDVDEQARTIRAKGTKTHTRDRVARVAEWAWPYVAQACRGKLPSARLFEGIPDRWYARDAHFAAAEALAAEDAHFAGYTMRDHRHTWAVRAVRSGWPVEAVARQLGHANGALVLKVYGRFVPTHEEVDRWERLAATRDAELMDRNAKEAGR